MFEFLFKYPAAVFAKGKFVLLGGWPVWVLALLILAAAALFLWLALRRASLISKPKLAAVVALQLALTAVVLTLLWRPALQVSTLKPQQNIVAVVVDDSRSMGLVESGVSRSAAAKKELDSRLVKGLSEKFQVRMYRLAESLQRIDKTEALTAAGAATRLGENLKTLMAEAGTLPIGAVVLMTDGGDNSGGIDLETTSEIRRRRIPVHTVGFGRERFAKDVELSEVQLAPRALADSRLNAQVTLRQSGYDGSAAKITVKSDGKTVATHIAQLKGAPQQMESVLLSAGVAGAKSLTFQVEPLNGEENSGNNTLTRMVNVEARKPRVLYIEGEPRWEFKFIRRAVEEDRSLDLVTILRTTQNKIYRQGIKDAKELEQGFPARPEELFEFDGLIIGNVEAGYLTPAQQELVKLFADRRGGGVLFLGGRATLGDGGYSKSSLAEVLPVSLPLSTKSFERDPAKAEVTPAGRDSIICRLAEDPAKNAERWKAMPPVADLQEVGAPKPGAVVLLEADRKAKRTPLLVTQNYGRGRTAVFATGGSWRWQMLQESSDKTHEIFWQQLLRWLVSETPGRVLATTPRQVLEDEPKVAFRAEIRDKSYLPVSDARVEARVAGPDGFSQIVELRPDPLTQGVYIGEISTEKPGSYLAEFAAKRGEEDLGRDVMTFLRQDGVAENFRAEQNRDLLEKLAETTGGRYWKPSDLAALPEQVTYSEAGITIRESRDLWDMPIVFLTLLALRAGEWLLRRKWGVV
ncbi:MAG: glutamine amidotransferase [Bryobacteraceae bacterium]|nr:glutamine amidotransferase [Bryobacteraceae bacterium]